jgi:hypothetical protein
MLPFLKFHCPVKGLFKKQKKNEKRMKFDQHMVQNFSHNLNTHFMSLQNQITWHLSAFFRKRSKQYFFRMGYEVKKKRSQINQITIQKKKSRVSCRITLTVF